MRRIATTALLIALLAVGCQSKHSEPAGKVQGPVSAATQAASPEAAPPPGSDEPSAAGRGDASTGPESGWEESEQLKRRRAALVDKLAAEGIRDPRVLQAMGEVPRHELVPAGLETMAYVDRPLPIGEDQTISQPYVVALMTELADVQPDERVLEVGTGSGYQAAVLAKLAAEVYTIEIIEALGKRAKKDLERLGLAGNIHFRIGDGYAGWPSAAPFDAIVVTAAPPKIPAPLKAQLKVGGKMVIPVGEDRQELVLLEKTKDGLEQRAVIPVRFVPMTGEAQEH